MRRLFFLFLPVVAGLIVFSISLFLLNRNASGNGALQVTSLPVSTVYLNDKPIGKTPLCKCEGKDMLPVGEYTIKLVPISGDNLFPYEEHIVITKGVLTVVDRSFGIGEFATGSVISLVPLTDKTAIQLFVTTFPSGVSIALDNNPVGTSPLLIKSLTASDHDVLLTKTGYKDKTIHIHTAPGYQLKALVTLSLLSQDATSDAKQQVITPTPTMKVKVTILDTGTGFLRVRAEPSLGASETARVKPGDIYDFLNEQDGWYQIQLSAGINGWVNSQYANKK